ncbi:MAG: Conjugative coupling factor TraD, SXT/TOL subfamily [Burkholderia sp.]|jgi:conjugal transfer pilus assembly protein TraD
MNAEPSDKSLFRPPYEAVSGALSALAAAVSLALLPMPEGLLAASALAAMSAGRFAEAAAVLRRRAALCGVRPSFVTFAETAFLLKEKAMKKGPSPEEMPSWRSRYREGLAAGGAPCRLDAAREGCRIEALWLGRGFRWKPEHASLLAFCAQKGASGARLPRALRTMMGLPEPLSENDIGTGAVHGIGLFEEDDILAPLSGLGGGTLIVGTTQSGKGVMLTALIAQAIFRGEPVIVVDPKSSKRLRGAMRSAARAAGRRPPLEFHPAFPDEGVRLDPLGAWTRPTELASRIVAVLPPENGAFGNFAWMAVNVAVEGLFYVTERPTLLALKKIIEGGIEPLLRKALARSFAAAQIPDWERRADELERPGGWGAPADQKLAAACELWEKLVGCRREAPGGAVIGGMIAVFRHNREHYAKITASLQPVLSMLTAGTLGRSFSPDPFDEEDDRPIVTVERVIEGGDILYLGLDALPDATVAEALGSIILADLAAYAGKRYNRGVSGSEAGRVLLFIDETANVINRPMIELLNKGLEAGIGVTAAMQTVSDLAVKLGSADRARQALGNFNNLIALRSKDRFTQEFVCETFGKAALVTESEAVSSTAVGSALPAFRAGVTRTRSSQLAETVPPEMLGRLPNTEFFASVCGGRLYKGRMPIIVEKKPMGN